LTAGGASPSAIAWAVGAVARRYHARPTCLVEALAADVMLRRRQYPSALHLGVRKMDNCSRPLDGHAWVECEGSIVVGHLDNLAIYAAGAWAAASPHPGTD
jgi:Transglutaminase-like superfamily